MDYLNEKRCLLILDNVESLFQSGKGTGEYREGYENYSRFFELLSEKQHNSCLLLTSREKPKEIARLESKNGPIRSKELRKLVDAEGREILKNEGLHGQHEHWVKLNGRYSGNPLALKLASEPIRELFNGDIGEFLEEDEAVVGDIHDLLDQQFYRLSSGSRRYSTGLPLSARMSHWIRSGMMSCTRCRERI